MDEEACDLLRDESNLQGAWCEEASWPATPGEASAFVSSCARRGLGVTVSGGRTGIVGGALPDGGAVLSTSELTHIGSVDGGCVEAEAGVTLESLRRYLASCAPELFFPPDPTEATASLGGMAATDASGSDSLMYGSTRGWIDRIGLVLPDGSPMELNRGEYSFGESGTCTHPALGTLRLKAAPDRPLPKDAAGYALREGMDLVDLFLGSEGTLGLVTTIGLRLAERPAAVIDAVLFHPDPTGLWPLVDAVRSFGPALRALEIMDGSCLDLIVRDPLPEAVLPPPAAACAVMVRLEARSGADIDPLLETLERIATGSGIPGEMVWAGEGEAWDSRMRGFRHALPETVNREISRLRASVPGIHKFGSDSAVPPERTGEFYARMRGILEREGLRNVIFGHAGQGHLHANVLPGSEKEMESAERCMEEIARTAVAMGGTVSAEHGLGRLKGHLLGIMHPPEVIASMVALRRAVDPDGIFARAIGWA